MTVKKDVTTATLNTKEVLFLREVFNHPLFETIVTVEQKELFEKIQQKLAKKKVDKKAVLPTLELGGLNFKAAPGNGSIVMTADKNVIKAEQNGYFRKNLKLEDNVILFEYFYGILEFYGDPLPNPYHRPYGDEFNVYENEVERTFNWGPSQILFNCYTGDKTDDNWTRISRARISEITRMLLTYLFLSNDESVIQNLPEKIKEGYPAWLVYKDKKDLDDAYRAAEWEKERQARMTVTNQGKKK